MSIIATSAMAAIEARTPTGYVKTVVDTLEGKRKRALGCETLSTTRVRKQLRRDKSPSPSPSRPRPKTLTPLTARKSVLSPRPPSTLKKLCRSVPLSAAKSAVDVTTPRPTRTKITEEAVKAETKPLIGPAGLVVDVDPFAIPTEIAIQSRPEHKPPHAEAEHIATTAPPAGSAPAEIITKDGDAFASAIPHNASDINELMERSKLTLALSLQRARAQYNQALQNIAELRASSDSTKEALATVTRERDGVSTQLDAKTGELAAAQADLDAARKDLRAAEGHLRSAQEESKTLVGRLGRRASRITALEEEHAAHSVHMHEARLEVGRLVGDLRRRDEEITLARSELTRRDEQMARHAQQIADLRKDVEERDLALRDAVRAIKKRDRDLGTAGCDVQSLRTALQWKDDELARDKRRIGELEKGMREMEEAMWMLRQQAAAGKGM